MTPATPASRGIFGRWLKRFAVVVVGVYAGLAIVLATMQTSLIFPGAASQGRREAVVGPIEGSEIVELKTAGGEKVVAMFGPAETLDGKIRDDAKERPTILYFYGNGMCMADCEGEFLHFRRRGFNVLIPDFLGYGMSSGKPSEAGVYATADACFSHLSQRSDIDPAKIVPMGWSLGAAAAIHIASTHTVPCLVTVSAFTSMGDMAKKLFPYIPASLFLRHHFENAAKIKSIRVPTFIAHGTNDDLIPFEMSTKLAAAAGGKVTKYDVEDGHHNDVFDIGGEPLMNAIEHFINSYTDVQ